MFDTSNRVAIVSCAQTELREAWSGLQHVDLISRAVSRALEGTGLTMRDVDFVCDSGSDILDGRSISNCGFLGAMGAHHKEESRVEEDGLWAALYGATKVASGSASVALVLAYSKPSESNVDAFWASQTEPFCTRPTGFDHKAACGLQAQAYLAGAQAAEDTFAKVVAHDWANAAQNPNVQVAQAPDVAAVQASPSAAAPLRELELSRHVDGAVAMLIVNRQVAHRVTSDPVWITGIGTAMDQHNFVGRRRDRLEACEAAAQACYKRSGLDPKSASLVECSGSSAASELMVLEALGLAEHGQAAGLYENGGSGPALNPSGGALPADPTMATGLVRLAEAAQQLTRRVDHGPENGTSAIAHGWGGVGMQNHCVFTLEV